MGVIQSTLEIMVNLSTFWSNKTVLVTGHTGFKGSWLTFWLRYLGAEVHGISLPAETPDPPGISLFTSLELHNKLANRSHYANICDFDLVKELIRDINPDVVFHLAAQALVLQSYKSPLDTWQVNVNGSLNILESLRSIKKNCAVVMVTTDKVYKNKEWLYGYRECDELGGSDPYSASKAAAELAITSWKSSFCGQSKHQSPYLSVATARSGNVIGGGDWAKDRIVPDSVRAIIHSKTLYLRNPYSTRPWQHVLDPLHGYMKLAEHLYSTSRLNGLLNPNSHAVNFGPDISSNISVESFIFRAHQIWPGCFENLSSNEAPREAHLLHLNTDKAYQILGWSPILNLENSLIYTYEWYKNVQDGVSPLESCLMNILAFMSIPKAPFL